MDDEERTYTNGEITVIWQPKECNHSRICFEKATGLPEVFDPKARPWINMNGATTAKIIAQVNKCPTNALSYFFNSEDDRDDTMKETDREPVKETIVQVMRNGPLIIYGNIKIKDADGIETRKTTGTAFCRCGSSKTNPYCDGTHYEVGFKE
jgi:uncharacterized Fe-S cluster protein YjdI